MLSSSFLVGSMQSPFSSVSFNHIHHSGVFIRWSLAAIGNEHPSTIFVNDRSTEPCYDEAVAPCPLMSEEQLNAFIAKIQGDTSLQEQLKAAATPDAVVVIAKEEGFSISVDDVENARTELSDEELEGLAGGQDCFSDGAATYC